MSAHPLLKVATKGSFRDKKKLLKFRFLDYFPKTKTEDFYQEDWSVSDTFIIIPPFSATYHLEEGAPVLLKANTKASLKSKKYSENVDIQVTFRRCAAKIIRVTAVSMT